MILKFDKPERICITDQGGSIVRLNDKNRTELCFYACDRPRARRILDKLNDGPFRGATGPYRLVPLIGEDDVTIDVRVNRLREMNDL